MPRASALFLTKNFEGGEDYFFFAFFLVAFFLATFFFAAFLGAFFFAAFFFALTAIGSISRPRLTG